MKFTAVVRDGTLDAGLSVHHVTAHDVVAAGRKAEREALREWRRARRADGDSVDDSGFDAIVVFDGHLMPTWLVQQ